MVINSPKTHYRENVYSIFSLALSANGYALSNNTEILFTVRVSDFMNDGIGETINCF